LEDIDEGARELADKRLRSLRLFEDQRRVPRSKAVAEAEKLGVSVKTWLGWLRVYRRNPTLAAVLRKRRKDAGELRFGEDVEALIIKHIRLWLVTADTIKNAHGILTDKIKELNEEGALELRVPSYATFYARCTSLPEIEKARLRDGKRLARLAHGLELGKLHGVDGPLSVVQIDHTELPVNVVDAETRVSVGKPWITVLIDVFSRMVIGFYLSLEKPGNLSTGLAISMAILPKTELLRKLRIEFDWPCSGVMRVLHADNAGEFHGNMLELGCGAYSIELVYRRVKHPNYGGYIESYLGTLSEKLRHVPGSTLGGPNELGDRDPAAEAVATMDEIERWVLLLFAEYHHDEHSSLFGQSPIAKLREGFRGSSTHPGIGRVWIPKDTAKLKIDFLPIEERTVGVKGILWDYIHYSSPSLQRWVNARNPKRKALARQFICRRDPRDLSRIFFWDPEAKQYFVIPYRNPIRPRITLWEHRALRAFLLEQGRKEIDEELLFSARQERNRLIEQAKNKTEAARRTRERERRRLAEEQASRFSADLTPQPAIAQKR